MRLTHPSKLHTFTRTIGFLFIAIGTVVNIAVPIQSFDAHSSLNVSNDEFSSSSNNSNTTSIYPRMNAPPNYTDLPPQTKPIEACLIIHSVSPLPVDTQKSLEAAIEELLKPLIPDISKNIQREFKQPSPYLNMSGKLDLTHEGKQCNLLDCEHYHVRTVSRFLYHGETSQTCVEDGKNEYTGTIWRNNVGNGVKDKLVEFRNGECVFPKSMISRLKDLLRSNKQAGGSSSSSS
ncbi:hypothetical protein F5876DRAFT_70984 [Lentinula aff. lateritia]|uniref:Uncharacterized protein n=1 Tax=Lentinula aff. lateritia TaxID=2804960 RepID=A0ACC1TH41_9AGAR|nr:hypothetical protein F5876DRAFT_70984 [Lentinula aff. lateritia]